MSIDIYIKKRKWDIGGTTEPNPELNKSLSHQKIVKLKRPVYIIQFHLSKQPHYDLRLEFDGVLKSWAIPKEPPIGNERRLAIQTEDHPLEYAKFSDRIPPNNYGAGTVKIWDTGTFETIKKTDKALVVNLKGKRLKGEYVLVKTAFRGSKNSWLFFKKKE